ncbi:sensor histidine kinase [Streptomyces sp. NBC_01351]|uniref:sensor histidine kinase n=1 Tax=Streptomyces sp. NBC_01351 TaxID=2903833 RepID=UPI002E33A40F|nr:sensor histidine kinase [Streptomyces sp. NBC_01351]
MPSEVVRAYRLDRVVLASGVVLVADCALRSLGADPDTSWRTVLGWGLALIGWLVLGFRFSHPVAVGVVGLVAAVGYYLIGEADGPSPLIVFMVALYTLARVGRLAVVASLAAVVMLILGYGEFIDVGDQRKVDDMSIALLAGWFLSVIAFGHAMLVRQAYQAEAEQRALAAERERDARALQAATEERLRIARELHDVLGHNISLMNIQAAAALHRSAKRPGETAELTTALEFVRDASRDALREVRATLGVLRQVDDTAPTTPAAGLERLGELVDRAATTGLRVSLEVSGDPIPVSPQISLAAYRIVQESLTNIARHAEAAGARIDLDYGPYELRVRIDDDGRGTPDTAGGSGIAGMTERARALGGELTAAKTESGFRVTARLPLGSGDAVPAREAVAAAGSPKAS